MSKVWISLSFIYILNFTPSYVDLLKQALVFVCQLLQKLTFSMNNSFLMFGQLRFWLNNVLSKDLDKLRYWKVLGFFYFELLLVLNVCITFKTNHVSWGFMMILVQAWIHMAYIYWCFPVSKLSCFILNEKKLFCLSLIERLY